MDQQFADRLAQENLPANYEDLVSQIKNTFPEYFFYGTTDTETGIGFSSVSIPTQRLAGVFAEMCKKNPMFLVMVVAMINNKNTDSAGVAHISSAKDVLFDDLIEVKE